MNIEDAIFIQGSALSQELGACLDLVNNELEHFLRNCFGVMSTDK